MAELRQSAYRFRLDREPLGGADRTYTVEHVSGSRGRAIFGTGRVSRLVTMVVQVCYARMGGRDGNKRAINDLATEDLTRIANLLADPRNYAGAATGTQGVQIRTIRRAAKFPRSEIWEAVLSVEYWRERR